MIYYRYYEPPEDYSNTVFDPDDNTFGPIMAAIQDGEFEIARDLLDELCLPKDYSDQGDPAEWAERGLRGE